jgi:hypothetical protein
MLPTTTKQRKRKMATVPPPQAAAASTDDEDDVEETEEWQEDYEYDDVDDTDLLSATAGGRVEILLDKRDDWAKLAYPEFEDTMARYNTFQGSHVPLRTLPGVLLCVDAGLFWPPLGLLPAATTMLCYVCGAQVTGTGDPASLHACKDGGTRRRRYVWQNSDFLYHKEQAGEASTPARCKAAETKVRHMLFCSGLAHFFGCFDIAQLQGVFSGP